MKKYSSIKKVILAMVAAIPVQSSAEVTNDDSIVSNTFWQAPYASSRQVKVQSVDSALGKECARIRSIYNTLNVSDLESARRAEFLRKMPSSDSMDLEFSTYFMLPNLNATFEGIIPQHRRSALPFYNQNTSISIVDSDSISDLRIVFKKGTLSAQSVSMGLPILPITVVKENGKMFIKVTGKDAACDVLDGGAFISGSVAATIQISEKSQIEMSEFYTAVAKELKTVLASKEGMFAKASRISFRLSNIIAPNTSYSKQVEDSTLALFKLLFDENNLSKSAVWDKFAGEDIISPNQFPKNVHIKINFGI